MELKPTFPELPGNLASTHFSPASSNRRVFVRFPCPLNALCQSVGDGEEWRWPAEIKDISAQGIGLILKRRFDLWSVLGIELQSADETLRKTLRARVVHTVQHKTGIWFVGCAFGKELLDDELQALINE